MIDRKFPIGPFLPKDIYSENEVSDLIDVIAAAPAEYKKLVSPLSDEDLENTYREGSWNVRQLVHHVADIHLLHFFRMKKALTEPDYHNVTLINMDGWAKTADSTEMPVRVSLDMFDTIGQRYVHLASELTEDQKKITYYHPLRGIHINQLQALGMSAWHVSHHFAHIELALGIRN